MEKLFEYIEPIVESYLMGLIVFTISAIIFGVWGVEINESKNFLVWNVCILSVGYLVYLLKH